MAQKVFKRNLSFWIPTKSNKVHPKGKATKKVATFQTSLRATLLIGQVFSLFPVVGVFSNSAQDVKWTDDLAKVPGSPWKQIASNQSLWKSMGEAYVQQCRFVKTSWRCVYSLLALVGQMFMAVMCVHKALHTDTTLMGTTPIIFYGMSCITMILFLQISRNWPSLVKNITRTEELDPNFDSKLSKKCNITCAIVLCLALVEHILSLLSAFAGAKICYPKNSTYEGFVRHFYPWVFNSLPYSPVLGIVTQFLHFQSTFIWNFSDLFVICMSYYLTSRLEQVNKKLLVAQGKYLPETFWRTIREEFGRATQLVRKVDEVINGIIFLSFANNLFFICLQLFNTLEDGIKGTGECSSRAKKTTLLGGYEEAIYFLFSLVYLITRSIAVSLIASQVNTASEVPAPVLYDVPSPVYCVEVQRFLDQVNGDNVALSGLQFFLVTRSLLLTVAGTIVTYELVMFQFKEPAPVDSTELTNFTTTVASINSNTFF